MVRKIIILMILFGLLTTSIPNVVSNKNHETPVFDVEDSSFDRYMNFLMKAAHLPSLSACIVKDDEIVWSKGYGYYDIENNKQATDETIYMIGSISKAITATALMQIIENKSYGVELDDDVNVFIPFSLRNPNHPDDPITFRMLLCHESSLSQDFDKTATGQYFVGDIDIPSYPIPWFEEYLTPNGSLYSPDIWTDDKPGEKYHYTNVGICICAFLVELISGQDFKEYCKENIFEPLEMYNTSFQLSDLNKENIAIHYRPYTLGLKTTYYPQQHFTLFVYPAGGLRTTVKDLAHFLIAYMHGGIYKNTRILNESTVEEMHTAQTDREELGYRYGNDFEYGLGWIVLNRPFKKDLIGARGSYYLGLRAKMIFSSSEKVGMVYFTNTMPEGFSIFIWQHLIERALFRHAKIL